ncbi:MAG TPA: glycosyltransferase family 39 protein [Phycisphaerae bacterium]|nr:glycosyltransferase family 39 protein [Phycisphaerae bacterium]
MQDSPATLARYGLPAILLIAALARLPWLASVPPPLNQDEASRGYDAWALLETGADRRGESWPFFLESFGPGDFTAALSTYLTIPFVALLGPTVTAMRLPCALLGIATVAAIFGLVRRWMGVPAALVAGIVLALNPWHISLTRTAHEAAFAPFFLATALWAWQRAGLLLRPAGCATDELPDRPSTVWAALGGLLMGGHAWVYPATRLFTPLFVAASLGIGWRHFIELGKARAGRRVLLAAAAGIVIGTAPLWITALTHPERLAARARATLIFAKPLPPSEMLLKFAGNLAKNIDPRYLFWQCDEMSGVTIPYVGQHLLVLAPLLIVGMARLLLNAHRSTWDRWILAWLFLALIPAAICRDWNPHALRTIGGLAAYPVIMAYGAMAIGERLRHWPTAKRTLTAGVATLALAANIVHAAYRYGWEFRIAAEPGYQNTLLRALEVAAEHSEEADFILVTNRSNQPYIYVLLLEPIPPTMLAEIPTVIVNYPHAFHEVLRLGKYYFAPHDLKEALPEVKTTFDRAFGALPPSAQGLVVETRGRFKGGRILATIPCSDRRRLDDDFEVRWWSPGEGRQ